MYNPTEFIECEHCKEVFDHDSESPYKINCPYCEGEITDASRNVEPTEL